MDILKSKGKNVMSNVILTGEGKIDPGILEKSYSEAMELTVSVAGYLRRREKQKNSARMIAVHARENMRLSSCLMQVMAWFMVQKGLLNGEISLQEAGSERYRLEGKSICLQPEGEGADELPDEFRAYLERAVDIYRRAERMDRMLYGKGDEVPQNAVHEMMNRLKK